MLESLATRPVITPAVLIVNPVGKLPEGHPNHPWEKEAIKAETKK